MGWGKMEQWGSMVVLPGPRREGGAVRRAVPECTFQRRKYREDDDDEIDSSTSKRDCSTGRGEGIGKKLGAVRWVGRIGTSF